MYKSPYTISIWDTNTSPETKICDIGSDTMTTSARALEPKLVRNINGKTTFQFKMYKDCYDPEVGKFSNPYLPLLINERVVKVHWEDEWYDFVIKNCQEDSAAKSYTFDCESWLVQELSKQGFNLEFDEKLKNNQGTIGTLAEKILKDTPWQIKQGMHIGLEYNKEAVYETTFNNQYDFEAQYLPDFSPATLRSNSNTILVFFSSIGALKPEGGEALLQFVYSDTNSFERETDSMMIKDSEQMNYQIYTTYSYNSLTGVYSFKAYPTSESTQTVDFCEISPIMGVSSEYRAKKLVNSLQTIYIPEVDKYCYILHREISNEPLQQVGTGETLYISVNGQILPIYLVGSQSGEGGDFYEFKDTTSNFAKYVQNLITNGNTFTNSDGWRKVYKDGTELKQKDLTPRVDAPNVKSYLQIPSTTDISNETEAWIFNSSIRSSRNFVQHFFKDEIYHFKVKAATTPPFSQVKIAAYTSSDTFYPTDDTYFNSVGGWSEDPVGSGWYWITLQCIQGMNLTSMLDARAGLFFKCTTQSSYFEIEAAELFKDVRGDNNVILTPASFDASGVIKDKYYVYPTEPEVASKDDIVFVYEGDIPIVQARPNDGYEYATTEFQKWRTITAKESNRFNLLQSLAEKFEVWCVIGADHDENGTITERWVDFKDTVGEDQNIGFIYGLDLKTVKRTIDSKQIVTKTIVKTNSNKYGENGFCTISRAQENYPKVNYVLDFGYYVNQGLLNNEALTAALYSISDEPGSDWPAHTPQGYYQKLHKFNTAYDAAANQYEKYKLQFDNLGAYLKVYEEYKANAESEKYSYMLNLFNLGNFVKANDTSNSALQDLWDRAHGSSTSDEVYEWYAAHAYPTEPRNESDVDAWKYNEAIIAAINAESKYDTQIQNINDTMYGNETLQIEGLEQKIAVAEAIMDEQVDLIGAADLQFQQSYGAYIQEGTWSSEDYFNDTSYYLDALDVAYTSARPRITYSIDILRLNALPDFKNKVFRLGDIAYVEDTEFFGYTTVNNIKTPYHEKVVLTELTQNLDDPSKDQFKVQNYRTQFEDLFQRITASVQSLQWNEADYGRAVDAVQKDQTINTDILQSSFTNAQNLVRNSMNNAIVQDASGISIIDQSNPGKQSRINAEGFFISTDGGDNWRNAVSAGGIATELLTAGAIDTNKISIRDGAWEAFRWDASGLNAYRSSGKGSGGVEYGTFVRFDKWGIYGLNGAESAYRPTEESAIWDNTKTSFALTWSGLNVTTPNGKSSMIVGTIPSSTDAGFFITKNTIENGAIATRTKVFYADTNGNLTLEGNIIASGGTIGGWTIGQTGLSYNNNTLYLGTTGIGTNNLIFKAGDKFGVAADGTLYATGANVSGNIVANGLTITATYSGGTASGTYNLLDAKNNTVNMAQFTIKGYHFYSYVDGYLVAMNSWPAATNRLAIGTPTLGADPYDGSPNSPLANWSTCAFRVEKDGTVWASKMNITGGSLTVGGNFSVNRQGILNASGAIISGSITASSGTFSNCIINNTCTINGTIGASGLISYGSQPSVYVQLKESFIKLHGGAADLFWQAPTSSATNKYNIGYVLVNSRYYWIVVDTQNLRIFLES